MLPVPVMQELSRLQDNITPFDTTAARAVVETDLGQPIDAVFSEFSERPIAAASLAQVGAFCIAWSHSLRKTHIAQKSRSLGVEEDVCFIRKQ